MKAFHSSESGAADDLLNVGLSEDEGNDAPPDDEEALRLARIDEYRQESLRGDSSLESNLGALAGGLLRVALRYEQDITKLLEQTDGAIYESPELQRAMSTYLNILRQVDRYVNLGARLAENRLQGATIRSPRRQTAMPKGITDSTRRNIR